MDQQAINEQVIRQFRSGGPIEGMHRDRLVLLTTTGRRSGEQRTAPMMFYPDREGPVVVASNEGAAQHPAWYLNLEADPAVTVELPDQTYGTEAKVLGGAEYERVWSDVTRDFSFFLDHQSKTQRRIPLVRLARS